MEEFVKGEEKTYILQAEPVEKEDKQEQEPAEENIIKNIEDTLKENNDTKIYDKSTENTSSQETQEQEEIHEPPKKIEVVTGNANDLKISNVSDYLEVQKPKEENRKGNIIIPEEKK